MTIRFDCTASISPCTRASSLFDLQQFLQRADRVASSDCSRSRRVVWARSRASVSTMARVRSSLSVAEAGDATARRLGLACQSPRNVATQAGVARRVSRDDTSSRPCGGLGADHLTGRRPRRDAGRLVPPHQPRRPVGGQFQPIAIDIGHAGGRGVGGLTSVTFCGASAGRDGAISMATLASAVRSLVSAMEPPSWPHPTSSSAIEPPTSRPCASSALISVRSRFRDDARP